MMVYGDGAELIRPHDRLHALRDGIGKLSSLRSESERQDLITGLLIDAGALVQGVADLRFYDARVDEGFPTDLPASIARLAWGRISDPSEVEAAIQRLAAVDLPEQVSCKVAEGYAFYAVYPQAYAAAARATDWTSPPLVIGLRSIGTSLGAAYAAGAGSSAFVTLRPVGHPFQRRIEASWQLRARLAAHPGPFAIVDEGPGLSGSSFLAAADLLDSLGVAASRITLFPSHAGEPGWAAGDERRTRWRTMRRLAVTFEDMLACRPIETWFEDITGPLVRMEDLSGGAWRKDLPESWPPVLPHQERRKFRLTGKTAYVARYAGLGAVGEAKFDRARALFAAGFCPEPLALRHGFLLERWVDGRRPAFAGDRRSSFLDHLARYLRFRAGAFPASAHDGASLDTLREMSLVNIEGLGGGALRASLERQIEAGCEMVGSTRPVFVDGRLHPWEWVEDADGRFWKTDAIDHACAHDLIGCQDIAWDIAGAVVEHRLSPGESADLCAGSGRATLHPGGLRFFEIAYCAFQGALWSMASAAPDKTAATILQRNLYVERLKVMASAEFAGAN